MTFPYSPRHSEWNSINWRNSLSSTFAAFSVALFCLGCGDAPVAPNVRPSRPVEEAANPPINPDATLAPVVLKTEEATTNRVATDVTLVEANWSDLQALIGEQQSKIVVVDVWSTACEPCMKEFPHLISLQRKFPDDVVGISFDVDYAGIKKKPVSFYHERVSKFLGSMGQSTVKHLMCTTPADELFTDLKLDSIPAIYVYDRAGKLARRFEGSNGQDEGVSYVKQVIPFVEELVKSSGN